MSIKLSLSIPGLTGIPTAPKAPNSIAIESLSFGIENPLSIGSSTGGAGAGKATFAPVNFVKQVDTYSAAFLEAVGSGSHFASAVISVTTAGAATPYVVYHFADVFVTSISTAATSGGDAPQESISLAFGEIEITFTPSNPNKPIGTASSGGWNQVTNTPTSANPNP